MKKILLSSAVVAVFVAYVALTHFKSSTTNTAVDIPVTIPDSSASDNSTQSLQTDSSSTNTPTSAGSNPTPTPTPNPTPTPVAQKYKDGTFTGATADAIYGPMQVQAKISGGQIIDIAFLQYPNDPGHTSEVANFALPQLKSEAIAAQSANVDIISGATQDSRAFEQSLASALSQAENN